MAVRTLQFCLVFAVGLFVGPVSGAASTCTKRSLKSGGSIRIKGICPSRIVAKVCNGAITASSRAISIESPPPLPAPLNQTPKHNVSLRFLEEPSDLVVQRGQDTSLRCLAKSTTDNVTITWLYEGKPLPNEDPRWTVEGSELLVRQVTGSKKVAARGNTGDYSCVARNGYGAILSRTAKVKVATMDKLTVAGNTTVFESMPMLLHCSVHSIPPADIHWEYNHLPLPKDKRYVPLPNGALLLRDTKFNDSGNYRCVAKHSILTKHKTSKDLEVKILPPSVEDIPPFFLLVNSSVNQTVLIGETVEFLCIASGWPTPSVQWINNKNVTLSNSSTLTISNAHPKDTGNYTCIATNVRGQQVQTFYLDVYQKPYFNATPTSRVSPSAQTVRIDCQAKGIPQPKIIWLKNGVALAPELRIKKTWTGLVFTHTISTDTGIYQCIAVNSVGRIWSAAQIEINNSQSPNPPQNVKCRPYDDDKICLTWKNPANVSVQAYSIYSSYTNEDGSEVAGPEYLIIEDTFELARGLKHSTNYTFYVRLYSKHASDHSEKVTCQPALKGSRNLDIETISSTTVALKWDELSSDTLCNGTKDHYVVQWFRDDDHHMTSGITLDRSFIVTGLLPSTDYQFRVITQTDPQDEPWLLYSLPDIQGADNDTSDPSGELRAPKYLREDSTTSTSTRVTWDRVSNAKFYTICYVPAKENRECDEDEFVKSYSPKFSVLKLNPNTEYLFRVRAHDSYGVPGGISQPLKIHTPADVPSPVVDLKFNALNSSTVCIHWRPPVEKYGKLKNYLVSYTTDSNWSLEHLIEYGVPASQTRTQVCKEDTNRLGLVSTYLTNLSTEHTYLVMVRAANDVGIGKPCAPIVVKTYDITRNVDEMLNSSEDFANNRKLGIILGVILAALCIVCCITFILLRRRCLKRRAVARARLAMSSNYHPAVAHYTSQLGTVQVRMEEPCSMDEHEIEHLVSEEQSSHIPPVTPEHLDTKGANDLPNGYVNGINKPPQINGNVPNGNVHITENPQYYAFECNGNMAKNKSEPLLRHYEEDSNSNMKPPKFYDFYKLFDTSKKHKESPHRSPYRSGNFCAAHSKSIGSCKDDSLNSTQLTFLDDSIASQRRLSPVLEPNG